MLKIGIIGPGHVGERHANALKNMSGVQLWSIAGRTLENAQAFADKYQPSAKVFNDFHHMVNDSELDAVIIATPDNFHAEQIISTAIAGKATLVEKPICTTLESGQKLQDIFAKYPSRLTVGYHLRWHPGLRFVAMKARNNEFGEIQHINLRFGIILCKTKDNATAEYALRDINKPIGLAEYRLADALPDEIKTNLPTIEELEQELAKDLKTDE